jgi:RNA polymerase sigma-70 factor (ECF subfamily)
VVVSDNQSVASLAESAFRRHYRQVYGYIRRRSASTEQAEDLTQAVFVEAVARLDGFRSGSSPVLAWLYTVAQRRLADEARQRARGPGSMVSLDKVPAPSAPVSEYGDEVASALRAAITDLPVEQRQVMVLKLLEGRRYAEIAARLGTSEEACRMRLSRALKTLRAELTKEGITP